MSIRSDRAPRRRLLLSVTTPLVIAATALGMLNAPVSAATPSTTISMDALVRVSGLSSQWSLRIDALSYSAVSTYLGLELERRTASGATGLKAWSVSVPAISCTAKLASCTFASGTALGTYGSFALTFHPTTSTTVSKLRCPGTGTVTATSRIRRGVLTGSLRLATHDAYFGTIRNRRTASHRVPVRIPVQVQQRTSNGVTCPLAPQCPRIVLLQTEDLLGVLRDQTTGKGLVSVGVALPSLEPGVTIAAGAVVRVGASGLTIDNDPDPLLGSITVLPPNPFLSGSLVFASHGPLETPAGGCSVTRRPGTIDSTMVLHLPGGVKHAVASTTGYLLRMVP